jgi:signal peptidase I
MFQLRGRWACPGRRIIPIVAATAAVLGLQGCGGTSSETEIRASVHEYVTALTKHDAAGACAVITPAYWFATARELNLKLAGLSAAALPGNACQRGLKRLFSIPSARLVAPKFSLTDVSVHGHTATASLAIGASRTGTGGQEARFIREANGAWRIDCCTGRQDERLPIVTYRVPSGSMEPTLKIGQIVTSDQAAMRAHPPGLGNIVIFHPPAGADSLLATCGASNEGESRTGHFFPRACDVPAPTQSSQTFIKRVVGVPGDRISIVAGHVYRNGVREKDAYITPCGSAPSCTFPRVIVVPPSDYFMLGDNRGASDDSRFWGPVKRYWITGVLER